MSTLSLDAEALYVDLRQGIKHLLTPQGVLVGVWSGGAWLVERLREDLSLAPERVGVISSALHRDDFSSRGLASGHDPTHLPFAVEGASIVLVDDVLFTGRTTRAVINELFDFGRPVQVQLAVLVDRGGRELPIEPVYSAARIRLPRTQRLSLARDSTGRLSFSNLL
jgi:pyrimidine operon attenuation protein / uracil phosphoribosyltransferase